MGLFKWTSRSQTYGDITYWRLWTKIALGVIVTAVVVFIIVMAVTAANTKKEQHKSLRGRGDAPRPTEQIIDGRGVDGIREFPDGWANVATACVWDGYRAFEGTKGNGASDLEIVVDESCEFVPTGPEYKGTLTDLKDEG